MFDKIAVTSDHAGVSLKAEILTYLETQTHSVFDLGPSSELKAAHDYPDFASKLAESVGSKKYDGGIAVCGTGIGMSIVANKFRGVRAACPWNSYSCEMARRHNDINFLCLGARTFPKEEIIRLIKVWLTTPFDGGRHQKRLDKIAALERV